MGSRDVLILKVVWVIRGPPLETPPCLGGVGVTPLKWGVLCHPPDSARNHVIDHVRSDRT